MPIQTVPIQVITIYAALSLWPPSTLQAITIQAVTKQAHNYIGHNYTGNLELEAFLDAEVSQEWQRDGPQCVHAQRLCDILVMVT